MAKVKNRVFRMKQFVVDDTRSAMKVGTDGVLVGAWADVSDARRVLDVGCGCGLIALMIAQRSPEAEIVALDIDHDSVAQAEINFNNSPWTSRFRLHCVDYKAFNDSPFDLIVSNPPFFTNGVLPPEASRSLARHDESLPLEQFVAHSSTLLSYDGRLVFITPVEARNIVIEAAAFNGLAVNRLTTVIPVSGRPPKRLLWELRPRQAVVGTTETTLVMENAPGRFSESYVDLVSPFYLYL